MKCAKRQYPRYARRSLWPMLMSAILLLAGCGHRVQPTSIRTDGAPEGVVFEGEFWRDQGLVDVLPYWTRYGRDTEHGAFFSHLDRTWQPVGSMNKYPGMVSRHLFSYSTAYLLTGDETYLEVAAEIFDFLIEHGWDSEYGGWYDEVERTGRVVETSKDLFNQAYAVTGLAMYYFVTHDVRAREYIDRSIQILEEHAWDEQHGGLRPEPQPEPDGQRDPQGLLAPDRARLWLPDVSLPGYAGSSPSATDGEDPGCRSGSDTRRRDRMGDGAL